MVELKLTFDYEEAESLKKYLRLLLESKELDKYEDGYKMGSEIDQWILEIERWQKKYGK